MGTRHETRRLDIRHTGTRHGTRRLDVDGGWMMDGWWMMNANANATNTSSRLNTVRGLAFLFLEELHMIRLHTRGCLKIGGTDNRDYIVVES